MRQEPQGVLAQFAGIIALLIAPFSIVYAQLLHPTRENIDIPASQVISRGIGFGATDRLARAATRISAARLEGKVGTEDGNGADVVGAISAAAEDARGRIIALDRAFQSVRIIDRDPAKSFVIGRRGSGPLEFRAPMSMWLSGDGTLSVADAVLGVKRIAIGSPKTARLVGTTRVSGDITGACATGADVAAYRVSRADAPLVEVQSQDGKIRTSFGQPYKTTTPLARVIMSEGIIGCVRNGTYALAMSSLPFVHGYDGRGARTWVSRIQDFTVGIQEETVEGGRHSIGLRSETKAFSTVFSLIPFEESFMILQVAHHTMKSLLDRREFEKLDTYLLDTGNGRGVFVSGSLPRITSSRRTGFLAITNEPFPQVLVYGWQR